MRSRVLHAGRVVAVVMALGFAALVLLATRRHGIGISTDTVSYAGAAESLRAHGTLEVPLTWWDSPASYEPLSHFPPAVPLVLAAIGTACGIGPYVAGRWLNVVCVFVTALAALLPFADRPFAMAVMTSFLAGPSFLPMHLWLWSEPLFLVFTVLGFRVAIAATSDVTPRRMALLGACCGLATLTRYTGLALFLGFGFAVLPFRTRATARALPSYCGVYLAIVLPWLVRLAAVGDSTRRLGIYTEEAWSRIGRPLVTTVAGWLWPPLPARLALPLSAAVFVATWLVWRRRTAMVAAVGADRAVYVAAVVVAVYVAFLLGMRVIVDPNIPLDERILCPPMILLALGAAHLAGALFPSGRSLAAAAVVVTSMTLANVVATAPQLAHAAREGNGFARDLWKRSDTIAWLRSSARDVTIFSNAPDAVAVLAQVPAKYTPALDEAARLSEFTRRVERARPSIVVLFDDPHRGWLIPRDRLASFPGTVRRFGDGIVITPASADE